MEIHLMRFWVFTLMWTLTSQELLYYCSKCQLPQNFCENCRFHANIQAKDTPQFVLFTYTGSIKEGDYDKLQDLFSEDLKNINGCPISATLFVVSEDSDDCAIHKLYYRGHEMALAGINKTDFDYESWDEEHWMEMIADQRGVLNEMSGIPYEQLLGMRAQSLLAGADNQYSMLERAGLVYDSSLLSPVGSERKIPWPYKMNESLPYTNPGDNPNCQTSSSGCPLEPHPALWQMPVLQMRSETGGLCEFLDQCFSNHHKSSDVRRLLNEYLQKVYGSNTNPSNRAPLQINLRHETLTMESVVKGLDLFIRKDVFREDFDTWVVTFSDVIRWLRNPKNTSEMRHVEEMWGCGDHREYESCQIGDRSNRTEIRVTLDILGFDNILIYQTVALVLLYVIVWKYDRKSGRHKKA